MIYSAATYLPQDLKNLDRRFIPDDSAATSP